MFGIGVGPSSAEKQLQGQEIGLSESLNQYLRTNYGEQQALLGDLTNYLNPIAAAGPNQTGFSKAELDAMNTAAVDTAGGNYANAARAVGSRLARGEGGVTSGIDAQINSSLAGESAGQLAGTENAITQANYATGRQNWENAMQGLGGVAQQESPLGYIKGANDANAAAFDESNTIQQQKAAQMNDIFSSAATLGSGLAGGFRAMEALPHGGGGGFGGFLNNAGAFMNGFGGGNGS